MSVEVARPTRRRGHPFSVDLFQARLFGILRWVVIVLALFATLLPFYYMFLLSIRPIESLLLNPANMLPKISELSLQTYREVLTPVVYGGQGFGRLLTNSLMVASVTVVLTLLVTIPGSYAIAKLRFFGSKAVGFLFLLTYLFPSVILAIPLFTAFTLLGLRGNLLALAVVYVAHTVPVTIYMLRGYFATIPSSLEEAAFVDGCTRFQAITRISLRLAMPSVVSAGLYVFMIAWNEFLFALLFLTGHRDKWTVSLGLSQLSGSHSIEVAPTVLMAGSIVITVPVIVLYFLAERALVEGLTAGAEKG